MAAAERDRGSACVVKDRAGGQQTPSRHNALDLLRGLAALGVVVYHYMDAQFGLTVQSLGTFNVYLFFMLSAIAMTIAYGDRFRDAIEPSDLVDFVRNRAARLLPLLFATAVALLVLRTAAGPVDAAELSRAVLTATGVMSLGPPGFISTVTGAWSIGIEIAFYAVVPLLLMMIPRLSTPKLAGVLAALIICQQLYLGSISGMTDTLDHWFLYILPIVFAPFFCAGFLVHRIGGERRAIMLLPMLMGMGAIGAFSLLFEADLFRDNFAFLAAFALCGLTLYAANRSETPAPLRRLSQLLGDMSYSLYLTHTLVFGVVETTARWLQLPAVALGPFYFALTIMVSISSFYLFERPLRKALRGRRSPVSTLP